MDQAELLKQCNVDISLLEMKIKQFKDDIILKVVRSESQRELVHKLFYERFLSKNIKL